MVTINYDDLSLAFDFVSSGAPMEHRAFVSLETGKAGTFRSVGWIFRSHLLVFSNAECLSSRLPSTLMP
jgi:hypothetical protein